MPHRRPGLTPLEDDILTAIVALSVAYLSKPLDYYYTVLGRIREQKFGIPGRGRGEVVKGFIDGHEERVTPKWESRKEFN